VRRLFLKKTLTVSLSIDVKITMIIGVVYLLRIFKMWRRHVILVVEGGEFQNLGVTCHLHLQGSQEIAGYSETLSLAKIQEDHKQFRYTSTRYRSSSLVFDLQNSYASNASSSPETNKKLTGGESGR